MKFIILAIAAVAAQGDYDYYSDMSEAEIWAQIAKDIAAAEPNEAFGACTLAEDHVYGTPAVGTCLPAAGTFEALETACCYSYIVEDPWGTVNAYENGLTQQMYTCEDGDWWLGLGATAGEVANTWTAMESFTLADGTAQEMLVMLDCNNAAALAGVTLALAAYVLY